LAQKKMPMKICGFPPSRTKTKTSAKTGHGGSVP
jgi:hypothetical protein